MERSSAFCDCLERETSQFISIFFSPFFPPAVRAWIRSVTTACCYSERRYGCGRRVHISVSYAYLATQFEVYSHSFFLLFFFSSGGRRMGPLRILYYEVASMTLPSNVPSPSDHA